MSRSYRMLCPISRALDRIGDRWSLLILRDLHAGPMRFGELQSGLPGLASNLLTRRLEAMAAEGFITHDGSRYALTALGRRTDRVLWELAMLGVALPPDPDLRQPGHLRLVAVTLQSAMARASAALPDGFVAALLIDGEPFTVSAPGGQPQVRYGRPADPIVTVETSYAPLMAAASGEQPLADFRAEHVRGSGDPDALASFQGFMAAVLTEGFGARA